MFKKLSQDQINEVLNHAKDMIRQHPEYRWGQSVFNSLCQFYPDTANAIRTTENDPYYNDGIVDQCINFIKEKED